ncbi:MAG TPA: MFS transporter [Urbifossiella sp.]|jgi:MFS family permease|nr:MFS transporter [Urbifossiella sp.]
MPARPSRARFVLVLWLCGLAGVLYLDRVCMSQAVVPIQAELGLTNTQVSIVAMAFTLAYGLFEIPTGRLGDRFGSRSILTRIVVWWSVFTALTGAAAGFASLVAVRFLFGAGEAGAFPNAARVISRWFPVAERGRVQGLMLTAAQLGGVAAPVAAAAMIEAAGWRWAFAAFGAFGVVWAVGFWVWFRDDPAGHPAVNEAELAVIRAGVTPFPVDPGPVPWAEVLTNRGILVLGAIIMIGSFFTYLFYTWFPKYLAAARGLENVAIGRLASVVLAGSAAGVFLGGLLADRITARAADPLAARRRLAVGCYLAAAACLFLGVRADDPVAVAGLMAAAMLAMHLTLPNWWSVVIPQCGRHVGALFGLMNGMGVVGALLSQGFVGIFADWRNDLGYTGRAQWDPLFDVYVGVLVAGAVAWAAYRPRPLPD